MLTDFQNGSQWLITPAGMDMIQGRMPCLMTPEHIRAQGALFNDAPVPVPLTVQNGVAVIPITGTITKSPGFFSFLFGGSSIDAIRQLLLTAEADPGVKAIVPYFNTPGGSVVGVHELAADFNRIAQVKPMVAYSDGAMCSAGYYLGAAAGQIILSPMAKVGSIGVLSVHYDVSKGDEMSGLKRTFLYAGKFKAIGNDAEPLSQEARQIIETHLQQTYDVFVGAVSKYRNTPEDQVRAEMAEGRIFIGQNAVDAGLADGLGSLDDAIDMALDKAEARSGGKQFYYSSLQTIKTMQKEYLMSGKNEPVIIGNLSEMQAAFPEFCQQIMLASIEGVGVTEQRTEAAAAEQTRIMGLINVHFGEDAGKQFAAIIQGGVTVEQYTAMKAALGGPTLLVATPDPDAAFKTQMLANIQSAGAGDPGAGAGDSLKTDGDAVLENLMATRNATRGQAIGIMAKEQPAAYQKWLAGQQKIRRVK